MTETTELRRVEDVHEAVRLVDFSDVIVYEARARRRDGGFDELPESSLNDNGEGAVVVQMLINDDPTLIAVRAQTQARTNTAVLSYDAAAVFNKSEPFTMGRSILPTFVSNVAMMALWPYLRKGMQDLASTVGDPSFRMGLLRLGDVQVDLTDVPPST